MSEPLIGVSNGDASAWDFSGCHFADVMGLTRVMYMVSISSRDRPFDSMTKKKTTTTITAEQHANTRPYR